MKVAKMKMKSTILRKKMKKVKCPKVTTGTRRKKTKTEIKRKRDINKITVKMREVIRIQMIIWMI